jgi:Trk K+ transport system NAD-binding subunit
VVCGDNPLAHRLVEELTTRYGEPVTVIMPSRKRNHGPQIEAIDGVKVIEASRLDAATFRDAKLPQARSLALVDQNDVGNIHAALCAQEVNADLRMVVRMFSSNLRKRVHELFADCTVLSDATLAAPAFVSAALQERAPTHITRLPDHTLSVRARRDVRPEQVVCTLATDLDRRGGARVLPDSDEPDDLVLALATGSPEPSAAARRRSRWLGALRGAAHATFGSGLWWVVLVLLTVLVASVVVHLTVVHETGWYALYVTLLTFAGAGDAHADYPPAEKIAQAVTMLSQIALVPAVTAALVDSVVRARLAVSAGRMRQLMSNHYIVSGLGNVGIRVLEQLHDLGVPVVGIETNEQSSHVRQARQLGVPVIIGDATQTQTLQAANVDACRALVTVTSDDVANLETALNARAGRPDLRVVLRLFDGDLAARVQEHFGITSSRSVSYLAAPAFAAALVERQVIGTIPVGRRVLLIADIPIVAGTELANTTVEQANRPGECRIIALNQDRSTWIWVPFEHRLLHPGLRAIVLATRTGLGDILARSSRRRPEPPARPSRHLPPPSDDEDAEAGGTSA